MDNKNINNKIKADIFNAFVQELKNTIREHTFHKLYTNGNGKKIYGNEWEDCLSYNDDIVPIIKTVQEKYNKLI